MVRWLQELSVQGIFTTDTALHDPQLEPAARGADRPGGRDGRRPAAVRGRSRARRRAASTRTFAPRWPASRACSRSGFIATWSRAGRAAPEPAQAARIAPLESDGVIIGTIAIVDDVSERVASERAAAPADRQRRRGAPRRRRGGPRQGRVPRDAVARNPDAAQRRPRLDARSCSAARSSRRC